MGFIIKDTGGDFELIPPGSYAATCYQLIDMGMVVKTGQYGGIKHEYRVGFEISELMEDGRPFVINENWTASMYDRSTMSQRLTSWRGRAFTAEEKAGFDLRTILGKKCLLNITHKPSARDPSKIYAEITAISQLPKGMGAPPLYNPILAWSWEDDKALLPDYILKRLGTDPRDHGQHDEDVNQDQPHPQQRQRAPAPQPAQQQRAPQQRPPAQQPQQQRRAPPPEVSMDQDDGFDPDSVTVYEDPIGDSDIPW